ncbi:MAG: HEPN domain-containing protein [Thermoplasmata archaeon]|nr:MAG: HEPN domain-containing protein [Thermoplasmata archaeon]
MNEDERKIQWCLKKERGISLVSPNDNLAKAYIAKAKESADVMRIIQNKSSAWAMSACYYSMYYSLYAVMMGLGVKSEIHSCSITFMRYALKEYYNETDVQHLERAFEARIDQQYYIRKIPKSEKLQELFDNAIIFYEKSQKALSQIDEDFTSSVREKIRLLDKKGKRY